MLQHSATFWEGAHLMEAEHQQDEPARMSPFGYIAGMSPLPGLSADCPDTGTAETSGGDDIDAYTVDATPGKRATAAPSEASPKPKTGGGHVNPADGSA